MTMVRGIKGSGATRRIEAAMERRSAAMLNVLAKATSATEP